jgi:hypothetical protein
VGVELLIDDESFDCCSRVCRDRALFRLFFDDFFIYHYSIVDYL